MSTKKTDWSDRFEFFRINFGACYTCLHVYRMLVKFEVENNV